MGNEKNNIEYEPENKELCGWITEDFYANFSRGEYLYFNKDTKEIEIKELGGGKKEYLFKYLFENNGIYCNTEEVISILNDDKLLLNEGRTTDSSLGNFLTELREAMGIKTEKGKGKEGKVRKLSPEEQKKKKEAKEVLKRDSLGIRLKAFETDYNKVCELFDKKRKEGYHYPNEITIPLSIDPASNNSKSSTSENNYNRSQLSNDHTLHGDEPCVITNSTSDDHSVTTDNHSTHNSSSDNHSTNNNTKVINNNSSSTTIGPVTINFTSIAIIIVCLAAFISIIVIVNMFLKNSTIGSKDTKSTVDVLTTEPAVISDINLTEISEEPYKALSEAVTPIGIASDYTAETIISESSDTNSINKPTVNSTSSQAKAQPSKEQPESYERPAGGAPAPPAPSPSPSVMPSPSPSPSPSPEPSPELEPSPEPEPSPVPVHRSHSVDNPQTNTLPNIFISDTSAAPDETVTVKISLKGFGFETTGNIYGISTTGDLSHAEITVKFDEGLTFMDADFLGNEGCSCSVSGSDTLQIHLDMFQKSNLEFDLHFRVPDIINDISAYHVFIPEDNAEIIYESRDGLGNLVMRNYNRCGTISVWQ